MKCPNCKDKKFNLNFNFQGYVSCPVKECQTCGLIWFNDGNKQNLILKPANKS